MNARARALVAELRAVLGGLPRARAVSAHAGAWLQVYIAAADDADVEALGAELGLDPPERVSYEGVSLYRAASSEADAAITVVASHGKEEVPGDVSRT